MFTHFRFRNEKGAIDLSSIMVGIIVLGLIGGVIAATVFAVIPWAQDQAAKKQLQSVTVAQNAYAGLATANDVTVALAAAETTNDADKRVFGSLKDLGGEDLIAIDINPDKPWLSADGKLCTNQTEDGFESAIQSASGNVFRTTDGSNIERVTDPAELNTTCLGVLDTEQPIEPSTEGMMKMGYECPVDTPISIPGAQGFTGNIKFVVDGETREADVTNWDGSGINLFLNKGQSGTLTMTGEYAPTMRTVGESDFGRHCLITVDNWDADTGQMDASGAFENYRNLRSVPRPPATLNNMAGMFANAHSFNGNTRDWDVSNVTDMQAMFMGAYSFDQPVNNWDVSKVKNMNNMFAAPTSGFEAPTFRAQNSDWEDWEDDYDPTWYDDEGVFNQPMNNWDTSNVTDMREMFYRSVNFNQPLNNWNTSNVTDMHSMFQGARSFNGNISNWDTSKVLNINSMFKEADSFNKNINNWDVSNITDLGSVFEQARAFNQPLNNWKVDNVENMTSTFEFATSFNQALNNWDVSNVYDMTNLFNGAEAFNQNINNWSVSNVYSMEGAFRQAKAFNQPLNDWDVRNVDSAASMFYFAERFNQPLNKWKIDSLMSTYDMFAYARAFNQDISSWDVSKVRDFFGMFRETRAFNQPLNNWDMSGADNLSNMFDSASAFNQPLDQWNVGNVKSMNRMFTLASSFKQNINNWDVFNVTDMAYMFSRSEYNQPLNNWNVKNVTNFSYMFWANGSFNQDIRSWNTESAVYMQNMFGLNPWTYQETAMSYDLSGWNVNRVVDRTSFGSGIPQNHLPKFK